jgi:hypothetical protein
MARGKSSRNVKSKGGYGDLKHMWEKEVELILFPADKLVSIRLVGPLYILARHWIRTSKRKAFPQWCTRFDSDIEDFNKDWECPACKDFDMGAPKYIIGNCIVRSLQKKNDANPVRVFVLPISVNSEFDNIIEMLDVAIEDEDEGVDIGIKYRPKESGSKRWGVTHGKQGALTAEELDYEYYDLESIIPDFSDEDTRNSWSEQIQSVLISNKYYVKQISDDIPLEDPWKAFAIDRNGERWTAFEDLVIFEQQMDKQAQKGGTPKGKASGQSRDRRAAGSPSRKFKSSSTDLDDLMGDEEPAASPEPAKSKKKLKKPQCFSKYDGSEKCLKKCHPKIRKRCQQVSNSPI